MIRIALSGCGEHSELYHATSLSRHAKERAGQVELAAAVDLNLERAKSVCAQYGFKKAYTDYREMLEKEKPDGVVAVMPVPLIARVAEEFMTRGIPCVIEKPIGANIDEARRLVDVAKRTGAIHMVSVNRRFSPVLNKAKAWVKDQSAEKGPMRFLRGAMLRVGRTEKDFVWGTGLHLVDAIRHVAGDVQDLRVARSGSEDGTGKTMWYAASVKFTSGALGAFEICTTTGKAEEVYDMLGEGYRARVSVQQNGEASLQCWSAGKLVLEESARAGEEGFVSRGEYAETAEFLDALAAKRAPWPGLAEILPSAEICWRLLRGE
jgi:myo-inositol 2-dehydrogenase / D-chiro-inositol 1-dehydrogenase